MRVGTPEQFRWITGIIAVILLINLVDVVLTTWWFMTGAATEANPLMDTLLQLGPLPFALVKIGFVSGGSYLLWKRRSRPLSVIGVTCLFVLYYYVLTQHLRGINVRLLHWH